MPGNDLDRALIAAISVGDEAAFNEIHARYHPVLELFYRLGHSCEEIAQMVNCPTNTVKSRMFHARRNMQRLLPRLAGFETG
jgi:RNA polymerase sigma-70 factor (ECF subfamily)